MSTPNFRTMDNFDLYVYGEVTEEEVNEYNKEFANEEDEKIDADDYYRIKMDDFFECIYKYELKNKIDEFNNELNFFNVSIKDGYYACVQFYVDEIENPKELDNDDCNYYFNMCRSKAIRKYDIEIRKVNKWLKETAKEYGFEKLNCIGVFSNGEAIYEKAE